MLLLLITGVLGVLGQSVNLKLHPSNVDIEWWYANDRIAFKMTAPTNGWVGIGWKQGNGLMTESDAVVGWLNSNGSFHLSKRRIGGYVLPTVSNSEVVYGNVTSDNGKTSMMFEMDLTKPRTMNRNDDYLLWAYGSLPGDATTGVFGKHDQKGAIAVNFFSVDQPTQPIFTPEFATKLHALCMAMAWVICFPVGAFIATFMRDEHGLVSKYWFNLHRILQTSGFFSTVAGLVLILYSHHGEIHIGVHQIFGFILVSLLTLQVALGLYSLFLAPGTPSPFVSVHLYLGKCLVLLGFVNCAIGLFTIDMAPGANLFFVIVGSAMTPFPYFAALMKKSKTKQGKYGFWFGWLLVSLISLVGRHYDPVIYDFDGLGRHNQLSC